MSSENLPTTFTLETNRSAAKKRKIRHDKDFLYGIRERLVIENGALIAAVSTLNTINDQVYVLLIL